MAIPIKYNIRNLFVKKITTGLTILGIALVVAVLLAVLSLAEGLANVFKSSGSNMNIMVLRKNSQSEIQSGISRSQVPLIYALPGIARDADQNPLASAESVVVINMEKIGGGSSNVTIRGVSEKGPLLRPQFRVIEGRMFRAGLLEVIVSRAVSMRFKDMSLGKTIRFGSHQWKVVGIFEAGGTATDSEIWTDAQGVLGDFKRVNYSSVLVRTSDKTSREKLVSDLASDPRLNLDGVIERSYYEKQTATADPIRFFGIFIGVIMAVGASFGAMNTMYATVSARTREIATLRVLGFSRRSILMAFIVESLALGLLGGILGCLIGLFIVKLALTSVTGTTNFKTFSEVVFAFRLTPNLMLLGMVFSLFIGFFGGILPATQASYTKITLALRESE